MKNKLNSLGNLSKIFVVLSILLVLILVFSYAYNLTDALTMDKTSYNCTSDSMMMQLCHDPFVSSIGWAVIYTVIFGFPVLIAWLITGSVLLVKTTIVNRKSSNISGPGEQKE